ncbi:30S ribosomal protein S21, chloroplastic-like [Phoenix dactylifera]|uniref:30S ribosomal protein S21, chloroplastic-like n=1 Tax=Phoenix dactylifera TaxID=42345 RepID=A0A8B9AJR1_PHODC|nr:30S ribosomal protein S21, chloroplastic-like [Phoenix dactylifera]XP_038985980.1 30S ribosomal protein S21, chloroplastic-like [Phoenix dactylifera]
MAASCNFFQLPFARSPAFPFLLSSHPYLPTPSRRSFALCSASLPLRPPSAAGPLDPAVAAVNPALRHANVLFFKSGYNVQVLVDDNESEEALMRRFRREVSRAGVIQECKRRRFFENKQEEKKRKAREAGRRNRRRRSGPRFFSSPSSSSAAAAADGGAAPKDDVDDNWDLPEGDLPY